ncbi:hypothetical protein B0J11DRAFT_63946 [Dendryphion nanum]|uniref:C2H2-type domain-containing protein n=1 Tax=Dendryphion nanum TaxID=256645 RepID=A0A9P9IGA3_9PLEO|nr:hypothetical protein B0J11DRAFT_63946 [Dendryphion nanum]
MPPAASSPPELRKATLADIPLIARSVFKENRPTICFVCLGDESVPAEQRLHSFSTSTDLSKHFKRRHLKYIGEAESFTCRLCRICLDGKMHVQRHAHDIHSTVS